MKISDNELVNHAVAATKKVRMVAETREGWNLMGYVGAALITSAGNLYTGINIDLRCGMGICAEYSAVAEMIKNGETEIDKIVATTSEGSILPPCGKCREMLYQINESNMDTKILLSLNDKKLLRELLPHNWQKYFDKSLYQKG